MSSMYPVRIETCPPMRLAAVLHRGAYAQIATSFARLWQMLGETGLMARIAGPGVAVYYDSPATVAEADLRSHAGVVVKGEDPLPAGFDPVEISAGRFAILTMSGPYDQFPDAWAWLYNVWLPQSGERAADRPPIEVYLNDASTVSPADLLSEIRVALL